MLKQKLSPVIVILIYSLFALSCGEGNKNQKSETSQGETLMVEVSINGMTCTGCEHSIESKVSKLDGVKTVKASFTDGKAQVEYLAGKTDTVKIREAITSLGYDVNKFLTSKTE